MLRYPRCIAPALLASFVGLSVTAARAEPATAASPAANCLAGPNGQAAAGNHWYYRVDRASGRHCWYQRPGSGVSRSAQNAQNDAAPSRAVQTRAAATPPPASTAAADDGADTATESREQPAVQAAPAAPAAPARPFGWTATTPAPVSRELMQAAPSPTPAPAPEPTPPPQAATDAAASAAPPPAPVNRAPLRAVSIERPAAPVEAETGAHMPVLLGAALALLIVALGSIVVRIATSMIRARRRARALDAVAERDAPPMFSAEDAPGLVPVMPRERDITGERRMPRPPRRITPAARPEHAPDRAAVASDPPARPRPDSRELEENVRDLLHRMRGDLVDRRPAPAAPAAPQPSAAQELDRMLNELRGRRRA
jgi:hypothetical protein